MCQLLETIKISQGKVQNIAWHQQRFDASRKHFFGENIVPVSLAMYIDTTGLKKETVYKCRIIYQQTIEQISIKPYTIKPIKYLKIVDAPHLEYDYKFLDRTAIHELYALRQNCDEVILVKNGLLTDSSYANLVFEKEGSYFTPATPMLAGTKRASLLQRGIIQSIPVMSREISKYDRVHLINAMLDLGEVVVPTNRIL